MKGVDSLSVISVSFAQFLQSNGFSFVGRYYRPAGVNGAGNPVENYNSKYPHLTAQEAQAICSTGLSIVALWEYSDELSYFTASQGGLDAGTALSQAKAVGQPDDSIIYFCVDVEVQETVNDISIQGIIDYFSHVNQVFENMGYQVGVYGEGYVCSQLLEKNLVIATWLSGSSDYPGSRSFTSYNIFQASADDSIDKQSADKDRSPNDQIGSFQVLVTATT